jgi:hypothetical protein
MNQSLPSTFQLTTEELATAGSICINVAYIFPNMYNNKTIDVVDALAEFFYFNPNATDDDILSFSGGKASDLRVLQMIAGGASNIRNSVLWTSTVEQYLSHTPGAGVGYIPIFWTLFILTTVVLGLRLWSRQTIAGGIKCNDWIMVAGYVSRS